MYYKDLGLLIPSSDADSGGDLQPADQDQDRYFIKVRSPPISRRSERPTVAALSACEAEIIAHRQAAKEAVWLTQLLEEIETQ